MGIVTLFVVATVLAKRVGELQAHLFGFTLYFTSPTNVTNQYAKRLKLTLRPLTTSFETSVQYSLTSHTKAPPLITMPYYGAPHIPLKNKNMSLVAK